MCGLCACGAQLSARKQLADAVQQVSDAARWGRSGTVLGVVSPAYRARFVASRSRWGEEVQMAETEVMEVHQREGKHSATALVSYSWYQMSTMSLRRTVVQQDWTWERDIFRLKAEQVVRGDPELFASPQGPRDETPRGRSTVGPGRAPSRLRREGSAVAAGLGAWLIAAGSGAVSASSTS